MSAKQYHDLLPSALKEVSEATAAVSNASAETLVREILAARRIALYGLGREGLMIRALCMRLMHLGFDAHMVGDMTTPPIGAGDLLIVSCGVGELEFTHAAISIGQQTGARVLAVTAQPNARDPRKADTIVHLPAQTMADDQGAPTVLPMGTIFEIAQLVFFDVVSVMLRERTGQTFEQIRDRHTNLE